MCTILLSRTFLLQAAVLYFFFVKHATAFCECGYSVDDDASSRASTPALFTDLFETDFSRVRDPAGDTGWRAQEYDVGAPEARGALGKRNRVANVVANPLRAGDGGGGGGGERGGDAGLQLWVRGRVEDGMVSGAEVAGVREDMLYGSFRVGVRMANVSGTCGAFFWYRNNSQEIDVEALSREFADPPNHSTVNLVLQTARSLAAGYDAAGTPQFARAAVPFRPDAAFHEYRFDWTPRAVAFFVDGAPVHAVADAESVPRGPGHVMLNHWSNGNEKWSGGPPAEDAVMTVAYVKAYFNSSDPARVARFEEACKGEGGEERVCRVPEQRGVPEGGVGTYFFTQDEGHAPGQMVFDDGKGVATAVRSAFRLVLASCLAAVVVVLWWL